MKTDASLGPAKSSYHNPRYSFDAASVISLTKTTITGITGILTRHIPSKKCAYSDFGMLTFFHFDFIIYEAKISATTITPRIKQPELQKAQVRELDSL